MEKERKQAEIETEMGGVPRETGLLTMQDEAMSVRGVRQ